MPFFHCQPFILQTQLTNENKMYHVSFKVVLAGKVKKAQPTLIMFSQINFHTHLCINIPKACKDLPCPVSEKKKVKYHCQGTILRCHMGDSQVRTVDWGLNEHALWAVVSWSPCCSCTVFMGAFENLAEIT